jgi:hypothetical protein
VIFPLAELAFSGISEIEGAIEALRKASMRSAAFLNQ